MKLKTTKYAVNLTYVCYYRRLLTGEVSYHAKKSTDTFYHLKNKTYFTYYYNITKYHDIYRVYKLYKNADIAIEYAFMSERQALNLKIRASL